MFAVISSIVTRSISAINPANARDNSWFSLHPLTKEGVDVLLVYGDPAYYGRFGFSEKTGRAFMPPYTLAYPFGWTGMMLNETSLPDTLIQFDCVAALSKPDLW